MIGFAFGVALWFWFIKPAIEKLVLHFFNPDSPEWREHIREQIRLDLEDAKRQAEIRRLRALNEKLRWRVEDCMQADEATRKAWQHRMDQERCCGCWENPNCTGFVRDAGTVEVVREMKALPKGSQND